MCKDELFLQWAAELQTLDDLEEDFDEDDLPFDLTDYHKYYLELEK